MGGLYPQDAPPQSMITPASSQRGVLPSKPTPIHAKMAIAPATSARRRKVRSVPQRSLRRPPIAVPSAPDSPRMAMALGTSSRLSMLMSPRMGAMKI